MVNTHGIALPLYRISSALANARYFVSAGRFAIPSAPNMVCAGCWSAMHKRALSKDYDYFIALYARVVKFTCHFNNWLPADAGSCVVRASEQTSKRSVR